MEVLIKNSTKPLVFELCNFEGIDLSRLNMDGFEFKSCTFMGTSLYAASMSQTIWLRCRGSYANFEAADLVDAQFQNCDFSNTTWRRTQLSSALYKGCKLTGASFEEVEHLGLSFEETLLVAADLRRMSFRKMLLQQIDFSDADLSGCDFRDAIFMGGSLRNAHTKLARFGGADLREVDVGGLKLLDTTLFRGATISHKQAAVLLGELGLCIA
ncbi:pentapeptide repeat-containing protein [Shewanella sp. S-1]|uniref:Pentapeptide repeat-containing protein n=2 Tax=Shewanella oncorhynchi TaxID=2726434 RepID=A0ABX1KV88_9GAMM|nr:pentapeptide repeat-containing protein [Shewanella oncorhynchi]